MLAAMTFGNCGYSLPAAMGAKVAAPHRNCVAYIGDGAWGMQLNEVGYCWFIAHSFLKNIFKRGWAMIAHERISLGSFAYLLGVATLGRVAGEIRVNGGA